MLDSAPRPPSLTLCKMELFMSKVTLRRQGNSVGVTFPADTRVRMGFEVGQDLTLVELTDGVKLVKRNLVLERQMQLARAVLREQADALQELATR